MHACWARVTARGWAKTCLDCLTVLTVGHLTEEGNLRRVANEDENGVAHGARKLPGIREVPMSKGPRTDRAYVPSAHRKALQDRGNLGLGR